MLRVSISLVCCLLLVGCGDLFDESYDPGPTNLVGVTAAQSLVTFTLEDPGSIQTEVPITGLAAGETILGMDVKAGLIYILGSTSRIYRVDEGLATPIGGPFSPALDGTSFGFCAARDWTIDGGPLYCAIVSNTGQYLTVDASTGAVMAHHQLDWPGGGPAQLVGLFDDPATLNHFHAVDQDLDRFVAVDAVGGIADLGAPFGQDLTGAVSMDRGFLGRGPDDPVMPLAAPAPREGIVVVVPDPAGGASQLFLYELYAFDGASARLALGSIGSASPVVEIALLE